MNFSLIIPTINRSDDLAKTLETIFVSDLPPHQILIIDQSDDTKTQNLIVKINNPLIEYHHFSIKSGAQARNYAIQKTKSDTDIVFFLDDDVSVDPECFAQVIQYMNSHSHAKGGLLNIHTPSRSISLVKKIGFFLLTGSLHFDEQFVTKGGFNAMFLQQPHTEKPVQRCSGCGMFFRKEVLDKGFQFPQHFMKYSLMEDVFLSYAIHRKYPNSLIYLPHAKIVHHESPNRSIPNHQKIRQQVIHRYLFIKHFHLSIIGYIWTIVLLCMLDMITYKSFRTLKEYYHSLLFIFKNHKQLSINKDKDNYNTFVFGS